MQNKSVKDTIRLGWKKDFVCLQKFHSTKKKIHLQSFSNHSILIFYKQVASTLIILFHFTEKWELNRNIYIHSFPRAYHRSPFFFWKNFPRHIYDRNLNLNSCHKDYVVFLNSEISPEFINISCLVILSEYTYWY